MLLRKPTRASVCPPSCGRVHTRPPAYSTRAHAVFVIADEGAAADAVRGLMTLDDDWSRGLNQPWQWLRQRLAAECCVELGRGDKWGGK